MYLTLSECFNQQRPHDSPISAVVDIINLKTIQIYELFFKLQQNRPY